MKYVDFELSYTCIEWLLRNGEYFVLVLSTTCSSVARVHVFIHIRIE